MGIRKPNQMNAKTKHDDKNFNENFCGWIEASFEYERLKKEGKKIPKKILDAVSWPSTLSAEDYDALIH